MKKRKRKNRSKEEGRIKKRRTNRRKGAGLSNGGPNTRKKEIMAIRRPEGGELRQREEEV